MNWPTLIMSPPSETASTWKRWAMCSSRFPRPRADSLASPILGRKSSYHHAWTMYRPAKRRIRR